MKTDVRFVGIMLVFFCISMLIYQFFGNANQRNALLRRGKIATAKISAIKLQGSKYKNSVCYRFQVKETIFDNCQQYRLSGSLENRLIATYIPVIYDSTNPKTNQLLLYKSDFQAYKLNYPDSLQWIENLR